MLKSEQNTSEHIVREYIKHGMVQQVPGDGAFDSRQTFSYLYEHNIIAAIRLRRNSILKSKDYHPRKDCRNKTDGRLQKRCAGVRCAERWIAESVFSAIKRLFGEEVRSTKKRNIVVEMIIKILLYFEFVAA